MFPKDFFKEKTDLYLKSSFANKLLNKLRKLINIYYQNLLYSQKLYKKVYNKRVKSYSYALDKKV